jgi:putative FmdB family regulatory protein
MPTYAYRCATCEHQFEQFQRFSDAPLTVCPNCGGSIRRVIHPVGVVFKGSGWYITDSRKSTESETSTSSATSTSPAKNGDSAKPEKKSEKAAEPVKAAAD